MVSRDLPVRVLLLIAALTAPGCGLIGGRGVKVTARRQLTFQGNLSYPALSADGRRMAYAVPHCGGGCSFSIHVQDLDSDRTREVTGGISQLYSIRWSPDSQYLLYSGIASEGWASYAVPVSGGVPRRVSVQNAVFSGGSLVWAPEQGSGAEHFIEIGGLDGVARKRIGVPGQADGFEVMCGVPGSRWMVAALFHGSDAELRAIDETGRQGGSFRAKNLGSGFTTASRDAVWIEMPGDDPGDASILRVPFDAATGRFASQGEVEYRGGNGGAPAIFSVNSSGDMLVVNQARTSYDAWAAELPEAFRNAIPDGRRIIHSAGSPIGLRVSPDGQQLIVMRMAPMPKGSAARWTVVPFEGIGEDTLTWVEDLVDDVQWADSSTVRMKERIAGGIRLSLFDLDTKQRRAVLLLPADAEVGDFVNLPDGSWAWISPWGLNVFVQGPRDRTSRKLPIPGSAGALALDGAPGGGKLAILGWMEPAAEGHIGVSVMSLPDGRVTPWWTTTRHDDPARVIWSGDGSLLVELWEAPEMTPLFRLDGPGSVEQVGVIPRNVSEMSLSRDLHRTALVTTEFHGDLWLWKLKPR